jgi:PAS domain S-box-containing protein
MEIDKEKTLAIIQNLTDGLMVFDQEKRLLLINSVAKKFFGINEKEVLGKKFFEFSNFPDLKFLFFLLGEEIKEVYRKELEIGENLILEVTSLSIMVEEGKTGKIVILHDITREKGIERMKTEFVSIAAHQLRTPLSAIKWIFERLLKERSLKLSSVQKELIQEGYNSVERTIALINDLLDIVKIEEGRYLYKFDFFNLEKIVQEVIKLYQEKIREKEIHFEFSSQKLPKVKVDREKITLAIQNLIDNAIRYTKRGGEISINLKSNQKEIEFSIQDNGIGIPKEQQKNIFQKFFRGSNALRMETEGSGLGLYITKNIIAAHSGKIWFQSEEEKGTTFYFTLPIK